MQSSIETKQEQKFQSPSQIISDTSKLKSKNQNHTIDIRTRKVKKIEQQNVKDRTEKSVFIKEYIPQIPKINDKNYQNLQLNDKSINFDQHFKPTISRKQDRLNPSQNQIRKSLESPYPVKSTQKWTSEIRQTLCRGFGTAFEKSRGVQYPSTSISNTNQIVNNFKSLKIPPQTRVNASRLRSSFNDSPRDYQKQSVNQQHMNRLSIDMFGDSIHDSFQQSYDDLFEEAINETSQDRNINRNVDSFLTQSQISNCYSDQKQQIKMYTKKQNSKVNSLLNERIQLQYQENNMAQQEIISNLSALKKCQIMSQMNQNPNRISLLRKITAKQQLPAQKTPLHLYSKTRLQTKRTSFDESKSINSQNSYKKQKTTRLDRDFQNQLQKIEKQTFLTDKEILQLTSNPNQNSDVEQQNKLGGLIESLASKHYKFKLLKSQSPRQQNQTNLAYQQKKYLDFGVAGEYFARKEYNNKIATEQHNQLHLLAATTRIQKHWTSERVAGYLTGSKKESIKFLLQRDKCRQDAEQNLTNQFISKVDVYVDQLRNSSNLNFLNQEKISTPSGQSLRRSQLQPLITQSFINETWDRTQNNTKIQNELGIQTNIDSKFQQSDKSIKLDKFEQHIQKELQPYEMNKLGDQLVGKLTFQQLQKQYAEKQSYSKQKQVDTRKGYIQALNKFSEPAIDIISKIHNGQLSLKELSFGLNQCTGLMKVCEKDNSLLQKVVIDNCLFSETQALPTLLTGINYQKLLNKLCLKRICIEIESAKLIGDILQKCNPVALKNLIIQNCIISNEAMTHILQNLLISNQIQKLAIVGQQFNDDHIIILIKLIQSSQSLKQLDLSYSRTTTENFLLILQAISLNRKLTFINISWNKLLKNTNLAAVGFTATETNESSQQQQSQEDIVIMQSQTAEEKKSNQQNDVVKSVTQKLLIKLSSSHDQSVLEYLTNIIKSNKLLHLDLSECGLSSQILMNLIKTIRNSKSLIGLHLSGNPGINSEFEKSLTQRLNLIYEKPLNLESFQQVVQRTQPNVVLRQHITDENKQKLQIQNSLYIKQLKQQKILESNQEQFEQGYPQILRHFIITRKIGHSLEMPGSQEWYLYKEKNSQCYICDYKVFSLFFWSEQIGQIEADQLGLSQEDKFRIVRLILNNRNPNESHQKVKTDLDQRLKKKEKVKVWNEANQDYEDRSADENSITAVDHKQMEVVDEHQSQNFDSLKLQQSDFGIRIQELPKFANAYKLPMIYGQFNNWQAQPMIPVSKIAQALDNNTVIPDFLQLAKQNGICRETVTHVRELNKRETKNYEKLLDQHRYRFEQNEVWSKALKQLIVYKNPHLSCVSYLEQIDTSKLYVAANFVGVGKQDYVVQKNDLFYFHQTIASFRTEDIQFPKLQKSQKTFIERNPDVFKDWQKDTPKIIEASANSDFQYWKIEKFVKDQSDILQIQQVLTQNYVLLKDIFGLFAARSLTFPCISSLEFGLFINECGLLSKDFTQGIVDTQFIASRVDIDKRGFKLQNQNTLDGNRFEFMECIVRIAQNKFKGSDNKISISQALIMLMESIKPVFQDRLTQKFRNDKLWTREVNLTLDANLEGIRMVYDKVKKGKKMSQEEAIKLMTQRTSIKLSETESHVCYALSLQTCTDVIKFSQFKCTQIEFLEFLEMIGRVANCLTVDTEMQLHNKINLVLNEWLKLVGMQRLEPVYFKSESDSEQD